MMVLIKNKRDFKHHVISKHSTTNIGNETYKCNECDFVAYYKTLEVHLGKTHTEKFECGLCENNFANHKTLEMHLKTCEIYKTRYCQKRGT